MQEVERVAIIDFGSQYTQLIARRIRELSVFTEILPADTAATDIVTANTKGVILSGGPGSPESGSIPFDESVLNTNVPVLGICYGMQLLNKVDDGTVRKLDQGEYGRQHVSICNDTKLFEGLKKEEQVWMSHGESVDTLSSRYVCAAKSNDGMIAAIADEARRRYGVQFHPEVSHTEQGVVILKNFLALCGCSQSWSLDCYIEDAKGKIKSTVGDNRVVSLVSGGVDSTAATVLCSQALGSDKVIPLHIDTGLMRANESEEVCRLLRNFGMSKLVHIDASDAFFKTLKGISAAEDKRRRIGDLFIKITEEELGRLAHDGKTFLCQGTLYTDLIESGMGCGKHADVIKSHHNVNPPIVAEKRRQGLIIEPNAHIFKDEVRTVSKLLGVPKHLYGRHPFPGPGIAIRILGDVTSQRVAQVRQSDAIFLEEITNAGLYDEIWQAFAVLLPVTAVGVMGDKRTEGQVIALRAVTSTDGMTADVADIPASVLGRVSTRIINEVAGINRVTYDVTSKPPGTIEWE